MCIYGYNYSAIPIYIGKSLCSLALRGVSDGQQHQKIISSNILLINHLIMRKYKRKHEMNYFQQKCLKEEDNSNNIIFYCK